MANTTAAELAKRNGSVEVLMGNLNQMFLLLTGCLIFCEYVFLVLALLTSVIFFVADNNLLLTEREGSTGKYWLEVVAVRTERSRTKNDRGPIFPSTARASSVSKLFIISHLGHACFEFAGFRKQKIHSQ